MRKLFFSSIALLSLTVFTASAQQPAMALQKGQKYSVETTLKAGNTAEVMGQSMETKVDSKTTTVYEVKETGSDGASLTATITKLQTASSMMGQEMAYDSEKKDNNGQIAEAVDGIMNKPRNIKIDTKGNITEQEEMDMAVNMLLNGASGSAAAAKTIELFIPELMNKDLKAGEKIEAISENKSEKMEIKETGIYTITSVENGVASISYSGKQQMNGTMEQMGMEMALTSNNNVNSELQLDIKTGMVLAKATVLDISSSVDAGGMTIPVSGKTTITHKVSQVN